MKFADLTHPVPAPPGHVWSLIPLDQPRLEFELRLNRLDGTYSGLLSYLVRVREIRRASKRIVRAHEYREYQRALAERVNAGVW